MARIRIRNWGATVGAMALAFGLVAGCDGGTSPNGNGEDPGDAAITATVTKDGSAAEGETVSLYDAGGSAALENAVTDAAGEAEFTGLDAATYDVEVTVPSGAMMASGDAARKAVTVSESGQAGVSFALVTGTQEEPTDTVEVEAVNFEFTPSDLTITPNTLVRWVNASNTLHTVTPDGHNEWTDTSLPSNGDTFEHVFRTEGSFPYFCTPHQSSGMTGTVTVQAQ